jgi:hypothetical protein
MNKLTFQEIIDIAKQNTESVDEFVLEYECDLGYKLGKVEEIYDAKQGGEGKGENWVRVYHFKDHDVYIKVQGYYQSYSGVEFYNEWDSFSEVTPSQRIITVYE